MPGLPGRPSRDDYGPDIKNRRPVRDASTELDGETVGTLMMHQLAGFGLVVPKAWVLCDGSAGASVSIVSRVEGWNTKNNLSAPFDPPTVTRNSVGEFFVDYNFSYPNEQGELVAVDPKFGLVVANQLEAVPGTNLFHGRAHLSSTPPAQKLRYVVRTHEWVVGVSSDWALADLDFGLLVH